MALVINILLSRYNKKLISVGFEQDLAFFWKIVVYLKTSLMTLISNSTATLLPLKYNHDQQTYDDLDFLHFCEMSVFLTNLPVYFEVPLRSSPIKF